MMVMILKMKLKMIKSSEKKKKKHTSFYPFTVVKRLYWTQTCYVGTMHDRIVLSSYRVRFNNSYEKEKRLIPCHPQSPFLLSKLAYLSRRRLRSRQKKNKRSQKYTFLYRHNLLVFLDLGFVLPRMLLL